MNVTLLGADGFVGSAFRRLLSAMAEVRLTAVTRQTYAAAAGVHSDLVIDASGSSRKFVAEERPTEDFAGSVAHRLRTVLDFPATTHVHISSVDVYHDLTSPATTREECAIDPSRQSHYGFHKRLAEEVVMHYAPRWLILRLAGMVGPGLRKNPVHDILTGQPLRIHPDSRYQFMSTDDVASRAWQLIAAGHAGEIYNLCGAGLISPREIAALAGRALDTALLPPDARPRIVDVSTDKVARHVDLPATRDAVSAYLAVATPAPVAGATVSHC